MENKYIISLLAFFILAAVASTVKIWRTKDPALTKEVVAKYLVYLAIVSAMSYIIMEDNFLVSLATILLITIWSGVEFYSAVRNLATGWLWLTGFMVVATSAIMVFTKLNPQILLPTYLFVVIFDGMSQTGGQLLGRRPLAPAVSPNKTWEGLIIGALCASGALIYVSGSNLESEVPYCAIFAVLALAGDLTCSKVKRLAGIKDFGKILPGHGGMLDRFDSFLTVLLYFTIVSVYNYVVK